MASSVNNTVSSTLPPAPTRLDSAYATVPRLFPRRSINFIVGLPKSGRMRLEVDRRAGRRDRPLSYHHATCWTGTRSLA